MCRMFCPRTERCITSILLQCTIIVTNESQSSNTYVHYKYTRKLFNAGNLRSQIRRENGSENGHNSLQPPNDKHQLDWVRRVSPRYRQHIHTCCVPGRTHQAHYYSDLVSIRAGGIGEVLTSTRRSMRKQRALCPRYQGCTWNASSGSSTKRCPDPNCKPASR